MVVAGFPAPSEVQLNALAKSNPLHVFAIVTASCQVKAIQFL